MSLELEHNGKKYRWVEGKRWGAEHKNVEDIQIDKSGIITLELGYDFYIVTWHTPDQLVALGYMEEVKEPEWMPEVGEAIAVGHDDESCKVITLYRTKTPNHWETEFGLWKHARQIPEHLQSEIKKILNQ